MVAICHYWTPLIGVQNGLELAQVTYTPAMESIWQK